MKDFLKKEYKHQLLIVHDALINDTVHIFSECNRKDLHGLAICTLDAILEYSFYTEDNPMTIFGHSNIKICFQPYHFENTDINKHIVYFAHLVTQDSNDKRIYCKTKDDSIKYWGLILQAPEKMYIQQREGKPDSFAFEKKIKTNKARETSLAILNLEKISECLLRVVTILPDQRIVAIEKKKEANRFIEIASFDQLCHNISPSMTRGEGNSGELFTTSNTNIQKEIDKPTTLHSGGKIPQLPMTKSEIESQIAKIKANKFLPEALRAKAIKQQEDKLMALQSETPLAPRAPVGARRPIEPAKKTKSKGKKPAKKKAKAEPKTITVEGKTITEGEADFCDKVVSAWYVRRAKAKQSARKTKTTPVFNKIAGEVADSVMKAVKLVSASEIKKDPKDFKIEADKLSEKAREFLGAFKSLLGSDFHESEVEKEFKELEHVIEALLTKHKRKMEEGGIVETIEESATEAANEPVTVSEEVSEEKQIERALSLAHKAAKHEVHATDTTFEGFKNRVKDHVEGSYSEMEQKIAYDCLHVAGFDKGGKLTNRLKHKYAKVAKVMREFYAGKLKTHKRVVKNRKQAQAIAMNESGLSRN